MIPKIILLLLLHNREDDFYPIPGQLKHKFIIFSVRTYHTAVNYLFESSTDLDSRFRGLTERYNDSPRRQEAKRK